MKTEDIIKELKKEEVVKDGVVYANPRGELLICKEGRICKDLENIVGDEHFYCKGCVGYYNLEIMLNLANILKLHPDDFFQAVIRTLIHESIHQALRMTEGWWTSHQYENIAMEDE